MELFSIRIQRTFQLVSTTLETSVNVLAPVLDVMYTAIKNEE